MNNIFKKALITFVLLIPFFTIRNVYAATGKINITTNNSNVNLGSTFSITVTVSEDGGKLGSWEYSLEHDSNYLSLVSGEEYQKAEVGDGSITSKTYTLKYKAISNGTTTIKIKNSDIRDWDSESKIDVQNGSLTINIGNSALNKDTSSAQSNKSSDNSLKSLYIEGINISPEFNKDTLEYNVELSSDVNIIKIVAEKNDNKASISGDGEIKLNEGQNTISIVVVAENGSSRTYKINAYVQQKSPINVKIDNKEYIVLKKLNNIDTPNGFEKKNIIINNEDIESFYNKTINCTLLALKDSIGNITLYIYNSKKNEYTKYSPIVSDSVNIIVLDPIDVKIPNGYKKNKFKYNNDQINGYYIQKNSEFKLIYGMNVETGKKEFYLYDTKLNTIQRFNTDQVVINENMMKKIKIAFIIIGTFVIIQTIIIIVLLSKNVKFKNKYLNSRLNPIDNPNVTKNIKYQDLEGTRVMKPIDDKKRKKAKTFLDE